VPTGPLFTFAHVTDVHVQSKHDCLRPFVEAVNAETNHERPDFVAFTGDMTVSGKRLEEEWALVRQDLEALEVPFYFAHGNHDVAGEEAPGTVCRQQYPETEFFFAVPLPGDYLGIFMALQGTEAGRTVSFEDRVDWLEELLKKHQGRRVLLFSHIPFFPPRQPTEPDRLHELLGPPWEGENYPAEKCLRWQARFFGMAEEKGGPLRQRLARSGSLVAHYSGHSHVHALLVEDGVHHVNTCSLGAKPKEYRWVQVSADRVEHQCIGSSEEPQEAWFYRGCTDRDHATEEVYHAGNPAERDFTIRTG